MNSVFQKLLWGALLLIAVPLLIVYLSVAPYTANTVREKVKSRVALVASVLAGEVPGGGARQMAEWAQAAAGRARARVTIIDARGTVLADSERQPEAMENHAQRPEVTAALQGGTGIAIRQSVSVDRELCYVAVPVGASGSPAAVLRLAVPLEEVETAAAAVRRRILTATLVSALAAAVLAAAISGWFTRRIKRLKAFAETLLEKRTAGSFDREANDELGELARTLDTMAGETRRLVERLNLEAARRDAILGSMVEGVLAVDAELRVIFCNQAFARIMGAVTPVSEKLPLLNLVRDPGLIRILARVLASGESQRCRLEVSGESSRSFEVQAAPLETQSKRGAVAILHDITELERLERVRKDFVANVSHELRTPLAAIIGFAETLLDGALEDEANNRRFVEIIRNHAVRLNTISADLLSLSELDAGREAPQAEPVLVRQALETALDAVAAEAARRNVRLITPAGEDLKVMANRIRLEQVLLNLLDNAVKFNRPGGEVRVRTYAGDGSVHIEISDTGIGIPSEDLRRIFERFYRVDKARARPAGGTGLGLSIVRHAVEKMNGTVSVESQLGKGSIFHIVLPGSA